MTVPQPLGTQPWEALKGSISCSQHCPRNKSDKIRRRGIRDELNQLRSSREPVVGGDRVPWPSVSPSVAGPPRAHSHSLLPGTWGLQSSLHPLSWPPTSALANGLWADVRHITSRSQHAPSPIYHRAMRKASMTHAAGDGGDRQARQARSPHGAQLPWRGA